MAVELDPHQLKAIREMHNGSILKGAPGTGKSRTALMYFYTKVAKGMPLTNIAPYKPMENPKDIYIITTAKKRDDKDWEKEAANFPLGWATDPNGVQLHVDSWNNIMDYDHVTDAFFIFDEQRLVGSGAWVKAFLKIAKQNQWIVLSATPGDNWMDYIPVFVANGFYKNRTAFLERHAVWSRYSKFPKVERYMEQGHLERLRASILVEMPYKSHTIRHVATVPVDYDDETFKRVIKDRWHIYEDRPLKNAAELFILMRKIVNSDPSRLGAIMELLEKHPKLIVFYNFDYELNALRVLANTLNYPVGEWNGHKHQPIPKEDKWLYLVQYTAGAEGWNCIETNAITFFSLTYSYKVFEQSKGRTDRMNTPFVDLYYYILRSSSKIDTAIWKALMSKKDFNMRAYAKNIWDSPVYIKGVNDDTIRRAVPRRAA